MAPRPLLWSALCVLCVLRGEAFAADPADPGVPERIEVYPARVVLPSQRSRCRLVVTGYYPGGEARDLTHAARYSSSDDGVLAVSDAVAVPVADGKATLTVQVGPRTATVAAEVSGQGRPDPVRFRTETLAILTRQGCNAGSCHGAPEGKGGFALSLFAYAPDIDEESLVRGGLSRRLTVPAPDDSLLLKKPLMRVPHQGGKRLSKSDGAYALLRDWIAEGGHFDPPGAPQPVRLSVYPGPSRVLHFPHVTQQLSVVAQFSDGSTRDVTNLATLDVSHREILSVDGNGLVTGLQRGQAAVTVRYLEHLVSVHFTVVQDVEGFRWSDPPESNYVDRLVDAKLRQLQYLPSDGCDDGVFVRRLYLDLTGLLPGAEEARAFLNDPAPDKRAKLVDHLLDSPEFARLWALRTADLLRVQPRTMPGGRAERFARWVQEAYRTNMPFDRFATELLTATGDARANPPANYFLASATTEDLTETTAQLFLGSRVGCARCHNHPFESWTQTDYFRIGAVFARVRREGETVSLPDAGEVKHPRSGQVLPPWGVDGAIDPAADRRAVFARWLTRPGNPYFARVEVNRIWAHLLGRGIVHPVDDFRSSNPPVNVELLDALALDFERSGYDRKHVLRTICNSRTYQRSSATNRFNETDDRLFSHALIRRLGAEELQDALGLVTHSVKGPAALDAEADRKEQELAGELARLERERPKWEAKVRDRVAALPFFGGVWHAAGPFGEGRTDAFKTAFPPEAGVDLAARYEGGRVGWSRHGEYEDGKPIAVPAGVAVRYYQRRLTARQEAAAVLKVESADAVNAWLNGKPLRGKSEKAGRATLHRYEVTLPPGESELLLKVRGAAGPTSFHFELARADGDRPVLPELPAEAVELFALPRERWGQAEEQRAAALQAETDGRVKGVRAQIERLRNRQDLATQRPYPEQSEFLKTFGQPRRDTACACERSEEPTVDQELNLLNGKFLNDRLATAVTAYAGLGDDEFTERLYLAAFARLPRPEERRKVREFLARAADRKEGVRDVVWAVVNTQEFLFQH